MRCCLVIFAVLLTIAGKNFAATTINPAVQNKNVERTIDLTTQLVRVQHKISVETTDKKEISSYVFVVPAEDLEKLAYVSVKDAAKKELKTVEEKSTEGTRYTITLLASSANPVLYVETVYTKSLIPHPTQIAQTDRQLVRYFGSAHFYSPYKTVSQKTVAQLASKNVESFTTVKPSSQSESTVTYGPYDNVARKSIYRTICLSIYLSILLLRVSLMTSITCPFYSLVHRENHCSL